VDLCGFTVDGYQYSLVPTMEAALNDSMSGIVASGELENITVRNGIVRDWNLMGIDLDSANGTLIEDVMADGNNAEGIRTGPDSVITHCIARDNFWTGIRAGENSALENCTAHENGGAGIRVESSSVRGCASCDNGLVGFSVRGCVVTNCTSFNNHTDGFSSYDGALITDCVAVGNSRGFYTQGSANRIEGNFALNNTSLGYDIDGSENLVVRNHARSNGQGPTDNYDIVFTNVYGPEISTAGQISSTNPWANFSF
jgi:hypothetical protein